MKTFEIFRRDSQQAKSNAAATLPISPAFQVDPQNGDTIVVFQSSWRSGGNTHLAPTDNFGNTYVQVGSTQAGATGDFQLSEWRAENIVGGAAFVVSGRISISATLSVVAICLGNAQAPTSYNNDSAVNNNTSTTPSVGSSSPAPAANSYFLAAMSKGASGIPTAGAGWQFFPNSIQTDNVTWQDLYVEEAVGVSSAALTATFSTLAAAENWVARISSFAPRVDSHTQSAFRIRNDDGTEATATWKAAENVNVPITPDQTFRPRFQIIPGGNPPVEKYQLQYRKVGDTDWKDIDTIG